MVVYYVAVLKPSVIHAFILNVLTSYAMFSSDNKPQGDTRGNNQSKDSNTVGQQFYRKLYVNCVLLVLRTM